MEQKLPIKAKKFLKLIKAVYFMLRRGISKAKLLNDLKMMMKRGKIAGKAAIQSLTFHHDGGGGSTSSFAAPLKEYKFSCSNSPVFHLPFHRKHPTGEEMMAAAVELMYDSAGASPALPGFGPSPMVRQLRITDSPFPWRDDEENSDVDEAAEEFINKFYNDLRHQNSMPYLG